MRRKLAYFAIAYGGGLTIPVLLIDCLNKGRYFILLLGAVFLLLIALILKATIEKKGDLKVWIGIPLGIAIMLFFLLEADDLPLRNNGDVTMDFQGYMKIVSVEKRNDYLEVETAETEGVKVYCNHYILRVYNWDEGAVWGTNQANYYEPFDLIGETFYYVGKLEKPKGTTTPYGFSYKEHLYGKGIKATGTIAFQDLLNNPELREKDLSESYLRIKRRILKKRESFLDSLDLNPEEKALLKGILFGDTKGIDEDLYEGFQKIGIAHILAVSGLHIGIILTAYRELEKRLKGSFLLPLFIFFLLIYGTASLWSFSVTRAIFLVLLKIIADWINRPFDKVTALAACFIFELIIHPYSIFSTGLQMSFLAALGIFHISPFLERRMKKSPALVLGIQSLLLPYISFRFGGLPLMGLLANIPVIALVSPLVILGVLLFSLHTLMGFPLEIASPVFRLFLRILVDVKELFEALGERINIMGNFRIPGLLLAIYLFIFIVIASEFFHIHILSRGDKEMLRNMGKIFSLFLIAAGLVSYSPFQRADFVFLDVGQGDALHLNWGRTHILIDGGGRPNYNIGKRVLMPYLSGSGYRSIDLAIATHLDGDHYKGLEELSQIYPVEEMKTKGYAGERIYVRDDKYMDILWPFNSKLTSPIEENEKSMVIRIYDRGLITLVTGDISSETERELVELYGKSGLLKCHILKVAHHGSAYSTSEEFLDEAKPLLAVISLGKNNYGHPSPEVIEKLESRDIMILRTDTVGSIGIIVKENGFIVCTKTGLKGLMHFSTI